jgi:hypothetical protein
VRALPKKAEQGYHAAGDLSPLFWGLVLQVAIPKLGSEV